MFFRIIRNWYPKAAPAIFKILDTIRPTKYNSTMPEKYLELPEDDDDENFPIGVSDDSSEETDGSGSSLENVDENESVTDSVENVLESIDGNSIKSQGFASGEKSDD